MPVLTTLDRTHFLSLAPNLPFFRQHRHSNNATLPPKHIPIKLPRRIPHVLSTSQTAALGKAARRNLYWYFHLDAFDRFPSVL